MSDEVEDFLAHYGVKGMKWGKRKAKSPGESNTSDSTKDREVNKAQTAAALAGVGAIYMSRDPRARQALKKSAVFLASNAGKAYRRLGETESEKIIRKSKYVAKAGAQVFDAYARNAGSAVPKFAGALGS